MNKINKKKVLIKLFMENLIQPTYAEVGHGGRYVKVAIPAPQSTPLNTIPVST